MLGGLGGAAASANPYAAGLSAVSGMASGGPSSAEGSSDSGGAVFNFAPPPSVQQTQSINMTLAVVVIVGLVLWLQTRK